MINKQKLAGFLGIIYLVIFGVTVIGTSILLLFDTFKKWGLI